LVSRARPQQRVRVRTSYWLSIANASRNGEAP